MSGRAKIGIIGGSGFYSFLEAPELVDVDTPFGAPSAPVALGRLAGRDVAFLPRHGAQHQFPPHRVNYRANLWALRSVGVRQVLAPSAVGSLRPELGPGTVVVPDQVVDRTWGRAHTVYDEIGPVVHVSFGDPYCPRGRRAVVEARDDVVDGGTLVVMKGRLQWFHDHSTDRPSRNDLLPDLSRPDRAGCRRAAPGGGLQGAL